MICYWVHIVYIYYVRHNIFISNFISPFVKFRATCFFFFCFKYFDSVYLFLPFLQEFLFNILQTFKF